MELTEAEYGSLWRWRGEGRVCATKLVDSSAACLGVAVSVYWKVNWNASRESFDEATAFWQAIQDFQVSWAAYPLWLGGDMNTAMNEHYAFDALVQGGGMTDVVLAHEGLRRPTTRRGEGPIDHLLTNRLATPMVSEAVTASAYIFPDHLRLRAVVDYPKPIACEVVDMPRPIQIPGDFKGVAEWTEGRAAFHCALQQGHLERALLLWSRRWETWICQSLHMMGQSVKGCQKGRGQPSAWQPVMKVRGGPVPHDRDSRKAGQLSRLLEEVAVCIRHLEAGQIPVWTSVAAKLGELNLAEYDPSLGKDPYELFSLIEGDLLAEQARARKLRLDSWKAKLNPEADVNLSAACRFVANRRMETLTLRPCAAGGGQSDSSRCG